MKKIAGALLLVTVATASSFAQSSNEWTRFRSPEGRYSALVPHAPKLSAQEITAQTGEKFTQYLAETSEGNAVYLLSYFDYTPGMVFTLDKARDGMIESFKATLESESQISLGGSAGRELLMTAKIEGLDYSVRARIYAIGTRVYILESLVPKAEAAGNREKTDRLFDSFQVTSTPY